jgi:hypothetical protein
MATADMVPVEGQCTDVGGGVSFDVSDVAVSSSRVNNIFRHHSNRIRLSVPVPERMRGARLDLQARMPPRSTLPVRTLSPP